MYGKTIKIRDLEDGTIKEGRLRSDGKIKIQEPNIHIWQSHPKLPLSKQRRAERTLEDILDETDDDSIVSQENSGTVMQKGLSK